jgi:hypothetical protein
MKSVALFSNKKDSKDAARHIIEQARSRVDFEPDLALFYSTLKYNGKYQSMLDIFHEEYGDIPQIGASVDGMIYPDDMHTDGAVLVLCKDEEAKIWVDGVNEKGAIKSAEILSEKIKCEKGAIILHFPLVHVPNPIKSAEFYAKGYYYSKICNGVDKEKQKEFAGKFADYCEKEKIFYLPPTILNIFAEKTHHKIPIIGINVMHTQVRFNSPNIFCNFKDINGGIAALVIEKDDVNAIFDDIFPDKGSTLEETLFIVREEFTVLREFNACFNRNVLISLDNMPPVNAVKNLTAVSITKKDDLLNRMDKGDMQVQTPYMFLLFNKKSDGMVLIGIGSYYPFDLYPFFVDVSDYSPDVCVGYEFIDFKSNDFISCFKYIRNNPDFKFFCIDVGTISAFGQKIYNYKDEIKKLVKDNYFGIMTVAPSAYLPKRMQKRRYISEAEPNIFFTSSGTNVCIEV